MTDLIAMTSTKSAVGRPWHLLVGDVAAAIIAAGVLAGAGALASGTGALASTRHRPASVFSAIALLRRHPTQADGRRAHAYSNAAVGMAMPASQSALAPYASTDPATNMGLTPDTTVTLIASVDGARVYSYVAADGSVCVQGVNPPGDIDAGGGSCGTAGPVERGGTSYEVSANPTFPHNIAVELAPNGVGSVTFTDPATGSSQLTPVVDNVAVDVSSDPIVASLTTPSGQTHVGAVAYAFPTTGGNAATQSMAAAHTPVRTPVAAP